MGANGLSETKRKALETVEGKTYVPEVKGLGTTQIRGIDAIGIASEVDAMMQFARKQMK